MSFQGLAVSVFYCFLNGEVRATIKQRFMRWQEGRSVATRYTRASIATTPETLGLRAGSIHSNQTANTLFGNGRRSSSTRENDKEYTPVQNNNGKSGISENGYSHQTVPMLHDEAL